MDGSLQITDVDTQELDASIADLTAAKQNWAQTTVEDRIAILTEVKDRVASVADDWATLGAAQKGLAAGDPLTSEEYMSGPYAVLLGCNGYIETLSKIAGKTYVDALKQRETASGQVAVQVLPHNIWEHLLLSGVSAEIWMDPSVTPDTIKQNTATCYDANPQTRKGAVSLVLGAGNVAAIAPMDCLHMLLVDHAVVMLKMNPVNSYLTETLKYVLAPFIERDALRIVEGDGSVGAYLCNHPDVEHIHITGAEATHDAIVWGVGEDAAKNKTAGTPINTRPITSELGAVCPTIVVPGPWTKHDIAFQAEQLATQKLVNSGYNCVAMQTLIVPKTWPQTQPLMQALKSAMAQVARPNYYPGTQDRLDAFAKSGGHVEQLARGNATPVYLSTLNGETPAAHLDTEVFGPALSVKSLDDTDPETYLRAAIAWANDTLHGTLAGHIVIHPATIRQIGQQRFEEIVAEFRYGCIAINAWSALAFIYSQTSWGAFPGHRLDDVKSGIGHVHNTFMFDKPERTVLSAPFRPFPRNLLSGDFSLLPKPPWFVNHRGQLGVAKRLTAFAHKPGWLKLPGILRHALRG